MRHHPLAALTLTIGVLAGSAHLAAAQTNNTTTTDPVTTTARDVDRNNFDYGWLGLLGLIGLAGLRNRNRASVSTVDPTVRPRV